MFKPIVVLASIAIAVTSAQPSQPEELAQPEPYSYSYDAGTHSAQESKDPNGRVTGSYSLVDADGRARRVDYYADESGFHAKVQSNEVGIQSESSADAEYVVSQPNQEQYYYYTSTSQQLPPAGHQQFQSNARQQVPSVARQQVSSVTRQQVNYAAANPQRTQTSYQYVQNPYYSAYGGYGGYNGYNGYNGGYGQYGGYQGQVQNSYPVSYGAYGYGGYGGYGGQPQAKYQYVSSPVVSSESQPVGSPSVASYQSGSSLSPSSSSVPSAVRYQVPQTSAYKYAGQKWKLS